MAIDTPNGSNDKVTTKNTPEIKEVTSVTPPEKKAPIINKTKEQIAQEEQKNKDKLTLKMQELAKGLTPAEFTNKLESLKNINKEWKDSLLSSMISQLSYKWIVLQRITGEKSISLIWPKKENPKDDEATPYENALNTALKSGTITMSDLQAALMYQTSSLDEFVKTNTWDKKEWLKTTKYVEFMINKYALNEKWLKDKNGNINVWVINDNVSNVWDRVFLLSFFTARNKDVNVKFDDNIAQRYNQEVGEQIKLVNASIPKETLASLGIYPDKTEKLTADFMKDPMGTMMNSVLENGWTWLIFWILALFFWKWMKWFATAFLWGTALQTLWWEWTKKVWEKVAELTWKWIDNFEKFWIDEKYKSIYNKILEKVKTTGDTDFTESDFVTRFRDFSKSEDFKKCNIADLENNYKSGTLDKFFTSKITIDWKSSSDYFVWGTTDKNTAEKNVKQNRIFLWLLLWEKEAIDNGKTVEELFRTKDEVSTTTSSTPEAEKNLKITQHDIINKAWIQVGVWLTILNQLKSTSIVNLETAYNWWKIDSLFKMIFKDPKNLFYSKNKTEIDTLVKTIIDTVPSDKKTQKVSEAITVA